MDAWREVQKALAQHKLGWPDIWKATVDCREGVVVLITADGRKFTHPISAAGQTRARTKLIKTADGQAETQDQ